MPTHPRQDEIDQLVIDWHERHLAGQTVPLKELCRHVPELLPFVAGEVARLRRIEGTIQHIREDDSSLQTEPPRAMLPASADFLVHFTRIFKKKGDGPELGWLGGLRVLSLLGLGGMGAVFRAEDSLARRMVALKVLRPDRDESDSARKRFIREARLSASLADDHVMPIFQVGEEGGALFIVMPHYPGETLEDRLRAGALPLPEVFRLARQLALGLEAAHKRGFVHRDLKPSNVWLEAIEREDDASWRARIMDFGLARDTNDAERLTGSGMGLGTPRYIAPEQAMDSRVDHLADLFSLGVVLYECVTGEVPFERRGLVNVLNAIVSDPVDPAPLRVAGLPEPMVALMMKLLDKEPRLRPRSAGEVAAEVRSISREFSSLLV